MFYFIVISAVTLIISLGNFLYDAVYDLPAFGLQILITVLGVVAVILVDGILAFVIRRLPESWFSPESGVFAVGKREKDLYAKTGIKFWKKYVPEWGCFTGFHKDKVKSPSDSSYLARFLVESNYGVAGHIAGALFGFLILLIPPLRPLSVALPVAIVNMILSLLPTMILRHNTPSLRRLYRRILDREHRTAETASV